MEKPVESCRGGSCIFSKEHRIYPAVDGEKLKVFNREVYILPSTFVGQRGKFGSRNKTTESN